MNLGETLDKIFELREKKSYLEEQAKDIGREIDSLEFSVINSMEETGLDKAKSKKGTVSLKVDLYPQVIDIGQLVEWAYNRGKPEILQRRVSSVVFKEFYEETGEYPDGIDTYQKKKLNFRKAK